MFTLDEMSKYENNNSSQILIHFNHFTINDIVLQNL